MGFFGSSKKEKTLLIDIGSTSVAAALTHNEDNKSPVMEFSIRLPFTKNVEGDEQSIETKMLLTLREVLALAFKGGRLSNYKYRKVNTVLIGLSSLWYTSKLQTKTIDDKNSIKLTPGKLKNLLDSEKQSFQVELKEIYKDNAEIFEADILGVAANGYRIENWINKQAGSFDITYLLSAAPTNLINKIEDQIIGTFGTKRGISINSINSLLSKLIFHSFKNIHSALLVDLSGDTTNLLFIHDGIAEKNKHLSFGISSLTQNISDNLLLPMPVAESALSLYSKGVLSEEARIELDKVFNESEDEWSLHEALLSSDGSFTSPQNIFLVSDTPYASVGKTILKDLFPDKEIIILDCQNGFLKECIKAEDGNSADGHLAVLGTYSQFLY
jgi:hypothetical protein